MHHSLSLYKPNNDININILHSLATLYYQQKDISAAYVWTNVATNHSQNKNTKMTSSLIKSQFILTSKERQRLDTIALNIIAALENGQYTRTEITAQY